MKLPQVVKIASLQVIQAYQSLLNDKVREVQRKELKMGHRIYKGIQNILFGCAVIIVITMIACLIFGIRPCVVVSGSMEPKIMTGSLCMIKNTNETPHKGDIVAFKKGEITVVHRIVKETGEGYVTKGDNNDVADPGILQKENITGRYLFSIPGIGYAISYTQTLDGMVILITTISVFILLGLFDKRRQ